MNSDPISFDAAATSLIAEVVTALGTDDLTAATPCEGWDVAALLRHMTQEHDAIARAADRPTPTPADADPREEWVRGAHGWTRALREAGDRLWLPRLGGSRPTGTVAQVHAVDMLVHRWDLCVAVGLDPGTLPDLLAAALPVARAATAPGSPLVGEGRAYRAAVDHDGDQTSLAALVSLTGRDVRRWWPRAR